MLIPSANTGDPYAPWHEHAFVVFDTETTGLTAAARTIEVGLARFERGQLVDTWGTLIHPGLPIPGEATAIHGISDVDVASAPPFVGTLGPALRITKNAWPCAYNATFDRKMLHRELARLQVTDLATPLFHPGYRWLDPLVWVRYLRDKWSGNKLHETCEWLGIDPGNSHRATDDAVATGRILIALREKLPPVTMTELLRRQEFYYQKQRGEMRAWFEKKGKPWNDD